MKEGNKGLLFTVAVFILAMMSIVFVVFFSRERIEPKKVVVSEGFSYIVMKDEAQEKLAREIFLNIENDLNKEGISLRLDHSLIQEFEPVSDKYKKLSNEVKDSISLFNIFNNYPKMAHCLRGELNGYCCKDGIKRIINTFKDKDKEKISKAEQKLSEAEQKIKSMTLDIRRGGESEFIILKDENLRANASTILKYVKEQIDKKEKGCYEGTYHEHIMENPSQYVEDKIRAIGGVNTRAYVNMDSYKNEGSYEAVLTVSLFDEGKFCIHDLESPKCDIFIDKLLKDMEKVCREVRIIKEAKEKIDARNQEKRENFLKSRGM